MAVKACTHSKTFRLTVSDGKQVYLIPLKTWLRETYENYLQVIERYKADKIKKYEFDYLVYKYLQKVAELLLNNRDASDEWIVNQINEPECDIDVVKAIMKKTINTLRNTDSTAKLAAIQADIDYYKQIDPAKHVKSIIDEF
jgi:hypothetical protein